MSLTAKTKLFDTCVADQWGKAFNFVSSYAHIEDRLHARSDPAVEVTILRVLAT